MKRIITTAMIILSTSFVYADTISISKYIDLLKANDPEYKNLATQKEQIKGKLISAQAIYDWQLSGQASKTYMDEVNEGGNKTTNFDKFAYETSLSKIFSEYATMFSTTYGYGNTNMTLPNSTEADSYNPYIKLNITQPILKNANGKIYNYATNVVEINKQIIDISHKELKESYFASKIDLYLTWIYDTKALMVTNQHYKNQILLHQQIQKQYKQDYIHETDLLRSKEGISLIEDMLKTQLNEWNNTSEKIFSLIGQQFNRVNTPDNLKIYPLEFEISSAIKNKKQLRTASIFDKQKNAIELDLTQANEKSKLQLDAFANYTMYDYDNKDTGIIGDMNKSDYTIGAQFSIDLEQKEHFGLIKENQEKIKEIEQNKKLFLRDHNVLTNHFKNRIIQSENSINKYKNIVKMSERRLMLEQQRYNSGKIPYKFIIDTQKEVLDYKQQLLSHNINKTKLNIAFMANNDNLLENINQYMQTENKE